MSIQGTVVSEELVWVEGKVLVTFSDGSFKQFTCYKRVEQRDLDSYNSFGWRFKTAEQLVEMCRELNTEHRLDCNLALHADKVRRLGADYRARGYY